MYMYGIDTELEEYIDFTNWTIDDYLEEINFNRMKACEHLGVLRDGFDSYIVYLSYKLIVAYGDADQIKYMKGNSK